MAKVRALSKTEADASGTGLKGKLGFGITYTDLVNYLGEPTYLPEDSGDGKVNFEWVVEFITEEYGYQTFTIYDWKVEAEYSRINTGAMTEAEEWMPSRWHVGGKDYAGDFVDFIENEVSKNATKLEEELPF